MNQPSKFESLSQAGFKTSFGSFKSIFNLKHLNNLESAMYTSYNTAPINNFNNNLRNQNSNELISIHSKKH